MNVCIKKKDRKEGWAHSRPTAAAFRVKSPRLSGGGSVSGVAVETDGGVDGGGLWGVGNGIEMVVFATIRVCKRGRGFWFKGSKSSGSGLISGLVCNMAVERGGGWWWGDSYTATVAVGHCIHKRKAGRG